MIQRARTNKKDDWTLYEMLQMKDPIIKTGEIVLKYDGVEYPAVLLPDGIIKFDGKLFYTPSGFSSYIIEKVQREKLIPTRVKSTSDGWKLITYNNTKLEVYRAMSNIPKKSKHRPSVQDMIKRSYQIENDDMTCLDILKCVDDIQDSIVLIQNNCYERNKMVVKWNKMFASNLNYQPFPTEIKVFDTYWEKITGEHGHDLKYLNRSKDIQRLFGIINGYLKTFERLADDSNDSKKNVKRSYQQKYELDPDWVPAKRVRVK